MIYSFVYMVQYASLGNLWNFQNFDLAVVFSVMNHQSSNTSINFRNTLDLTWGVFFKLFPSRVHTAHRKLWAKQFCVFFENIKILIFFKNTQNCFVYISATKYRSDVVLYSKRTAGYPLSPHIKNITLAFYKRSNTSNKKLYFDNIEKTTNFGCTVCTLDGNNLKKTP